nr:aminopeptidase N [Nocardioides perillae]
MQRTEATARAALLDVQHYDVSLDLSGGDAEETTTFRSVTTVRFTSQGGATFVDLKPVALHTARLDGQALDVDTLERGRLPLTTTAGEHELVVEATMRYRNDGEGLHRSTDPADGLLYVYGMSFMDAAPSVFACFDQPDLKAPYTLHVRAPQSWTVVGNAPGEQVEPGVWELERSQPLATYFTTLVAGPWHVVRDEHDGIRLGLSARRSIAAHLDADAEELLTLTRQCFDEFHRLFGIRYPFGDYHQAFVPEFNAGAMENPGCVTFRDPLVFTSKVTRGVRIQRATTVAHEMAHQWFGNLVTPRWWDDLWLNESFAEYMGNRVTADVTEFGDAWTHNAHARRQWGLVADQRPSTHPVAGNGAVDATAALQDFDGISYSKGASILKQVNARLGDEVFLAGAVDHFTRHRFANATKDDLFGSWEQALRDAGRDEDAGAFPASSRAWLTTAGPDAIDLDRSAGVLRRTPPADHPADRTHTFRVAAAEPGGSWQVEQVTVDGPETAYDAGGRAVVLDPFEDTWALVRPDTETVAALRDLLPRTDDAALRAGVWNGLRSAFHTGRLDPADALDLLEAGLPVEDSDDALFYVVPWALGKVAPLSADPAASLARVHRATLAKAEAAEPGSTLQLAAFQGAASSAADDDLLRAWGAGQRLPEGVEVDLDLRWRILVRLAALGAVSRDELDAALAEEPTARSRVEHTRALAALPDAEAKAFAWARFAGEVSVPNYELEAAGESMWRHGQEAVTAPYVERYFAELPGATAHFSGWVLADVAEAYFPMTALDPRTVELARDLVARPGLDPSLRRRVVDCLDELERRLAVRATYGA